MNNTRDFSNFSSREDLFSLNESDLDRIISEESGIPMMGMPTPPAQSNDSVTVNQPSRVETVYKEYNEVLDQLDDNSNVTTNTQDFYNEQPINTNTNNIEENVTDVNNVDPFSIAFELVKQMDLIRLPDNLDSLDEDTLRYYANVTKEIQREEAIESIIESVSHDPYISDLITYALDGGSYVDMPRMQNIIDSRMSYENLDLSKESLQRKIVQKYLSEGLDPKDDRDRRLLELIPSQIQLHAHNGTLRKEAEIARNHFLNQIAAAQQEEYDRTQQLIQEEQERKRQEELELKQWDEQFRKTLAERNWSEDKKQSIKNELKPVTLSNGQTIPSWQLKQEMIFESPELFQMYLDFVSKFDFNQGKFITDNNDNIKTSPVVQQLLENYNKKQTFSSKNNVNNQSPQKENIKRVVDPKKEFFF